MISCSVITLRLIMKILKAFLLGLVLICLSSVEIYSHNINEPAEIPKNQNFNVFEENGKFGLKNEHGDVLIPAQHDALGWSNGKFSVINNVTGYQIKGLWGIINISNHRITKTEYVDLSPGEGSLLVARKKLPHTVTILTGCINTSGKEIIPFQYEGLSISSFRAIVFSKTNNQFKHGLIDFENKLLIPIQYASIYPLGSLRYAVENFENKIAIFSEDGKQITNFLIDSISSFKKNYAIYYQNQRQGLIDREGQIKLEPVYREIVIRDDGSIMTRQADAWLFLNGENKLIRQINADSIQAILPGILKIKTAGKIQLTNEAFIPLNENVFSFVGNFHKGKALFKKGNGTGLLRSDGTIALETKYNDLILDNKFIIARQWVDNRNRYVVLDSLGKILTTKNYDFIGKFNGSFFPVKNKNYWGALNASGKEIIACVHDSIVDQVSNHVVVKFKGGYGIINLNEDWIITPQASRLKLWDDERYLEITPRTTFLKSFPKTIIYFTDNKVEIKNDFLVEHTSSGALWKIDRNGVITERLLEPEAVEKVFPESEGLRAIKKDGRYGFIDNRGRLRIANRYEDVKAFSGSLAAAKIRGKWGFINHHDNIAIQPVYDEIYSFQDNVAIVKQKNYFGLIDLNGKLILPVRYDEIKILPGKHLLILQNGLYGLTDSNGKTFINPKFNQLIDLNNGYVIVERDGKFGLLTKQGLSTIPEIYDGLSFDTYHNQYIAFKKAAWEVAKF
jgi:hypothetical protein